MWSPLTVMPLNTRNASVFASPHKPLKKAKPQFNSKEKWRNNTMHGSKRAFWYRGPTWIILPS